MFLYSIKSYIKSNKTFTKFALWKLIKYITKIVWLL